MRKFLFVSLAAAALLATSFSAAQEPAAAPLGVHQLSANVYWVDGGVSNSGIIVGDKGVIIIDTKMTPENGKQLVEAAAKITPKPITTVILTHRDVDHIGGLPSFPKGVEIIATEVVPSTPRPNPDGGPRGPGAFRAPSVVPTKVLTNKKEVLNLDGVKLELLHWAPAHTSGDTAVYLPAEKIVFTGDIFVEFSTPLIHEEQHGSSAGWIETVKGLLALDADTYIPGHGNVLTKQTIEPRLKLAESERAKIVELVAQGESLAEIEAAVGDPKPEDAAAGPRFPPYSEVVYNELTKKAP
jgi:cyclase